jgi:Gram-negative bacterial TonB protein C-terminal
LPELLTAYSVFMFGARLWDSWAISSNVDRDDLVSQAPVHSTPPPLPLEGQRTALPQRVRVGVLPSASRHPILNAYAERAVNQWKYEPGLFQGEPVSIITTVLVNFE